MTYPTKCPSCGASLQPVALDPETAPWLCPIFHPGLRGFFTAELTSGLFRSQHSDFGFSPDRLTLREAVHAELAAARLRGSSLREDQIGLADVSLLQFVHDHQQVHESFRALVAAQLASRKGSA